MKPMPFDINREIRITRAYVAIASALISDEVQLTIGELSAAELREALYRVAEQLVAKHERPQNAETPPTR